MPTRQDHSIEAIEAARAWQRRILLRADPLFVELNAEAVEKWHQQREPILVYEQRIDEAGS